MQTPSRGLTDGVFTHPQEKPFSTPFYSHSFLTSDGRSVGPGTSLQLDVNASDYEDAGACTCFVYCARGLGRRRVAGVLSKAWRGQLELCLVARDGAMRRRGLSPRLNLCVADPHSAAACCTVTRRATQGGWAKPLSSFFAVDGGSLHATRALGPEDKVKAMYRQSAGLVVAAAQLTATPRARTELQRAQNQWAL